MKIPSSAEGSSHLLLGSVNDIVCLWHEKCSCQASLLASSCHSSFLQLSLLACQTGVTAGILSHCRNPLILCIPSSWVRNCTLCVTKYRIRVQGCFWSDKARSRMYVPRGIQLTLFDLKDQFTSTQFKHLPKRIRICIHLLHVRCTHDYYSICMLDFYIVSVSLSLKLSHGIQLVSSKPRRCILHVYNSSQKSFYSFTGTENLQLTRHLQL